MKTIRTSPGSVWPVDVVGSSSELVIGNAPGILIVLLLCSEADSTIALLCGFWRAIWPRRTPREGCGGAGVLSSVIFAFVANSSSGVVSLSNTQGMWLHWRVG